MSIQKNKFLVAIFIIMAACIAVIAVLIVPNINDIIKINQDILSQREELERKASLGLNIKQISLDMTEVEKNMDYLNAMFIKSGNELEFLSALDVLAQEDKVDSQTAPKFPEQTIVRPTPVPLDITASGNYSSIMNYLSDLEAMPYYYNVDSVEIQGQNNSVSAHLSGNTYINK